MKFQEEEEAYKRLPMPVCEPSNKKNEKSLNSPTNSDSESNLEPAEQKRRALKKI